MNLLLEMVAGERGTAHNLYKIILTGEIDETTEINCTEIKSRLESELYFVKVKNRTEYKLDYEQLSLEPSLKGIFVKKMLEKQAAVSTEAEKEIIKKALNLGIRAFMGEVKYDED